MLIDPLELGLLNSVGGNLLKQSHKGSNQERQGLDIAGPNVSGQRGERRCPNSILYKREFN